MSILKSRLLAVLFLLGHTCAAWACEDPDHVALTVTVADADVTSFEFCPDDLAQLPNASFSTKTLWTDGPQTFQGVWLATIFDQLGVTEGEATLRATNDYAVTARVEQFEQGGALVAYKRNGSFMSRRENGPYWLVWNYDAEARFRTEQIYAMSVWQLDRIVISR